MMDLAAESGRDLTGLEQLKALMASGRNAPIADTLDFTLAEIEEGRVVFEGTPTLKVYNPIGAVHGGWAATLLDSACGCAVHSRLLAEQAYTTLELKVAYHRAMTETTGLVRAEGTVISMGRRAAFAEAKLTDASGRLYASATSTLIVMDRQRRPDSSPAAG
ncbi:MAG: PaaI family thioesterase [Rhizobiaceae bacterium]|nr:PaaI family thioesterase [Rhizobiaceae bacterium]MCV0406533.1 PaaI family thioesterase [Rhizobiaceae bacterium]